MSPDVEQPAPVVGAGPQVLAPPTGPPAPGPAGSHRDHHLLRDPEHDRWRWRARIRRSPTQRRLYRGVVAIVGLLLIALGCVSGPLPGPGGIPLVLLGLAVWSSEFVWAQRVMTWFKAQLHRFQAWSRPRQALALAAFLAVCGLCGYGYLLVLGAPRWLPDQVHTVLDRLPGL